MARRHLLGGEGGRRGSLDARTADGSARPACEACVSHLAIQAMVEWRHQSRALGVLSAEARTDRRVAYPELSPEKGTRLL